jgi:hypothetical protein
MFTCIKKGKDNDSQNLRFFGAPGVYMFKGFTKTIDQAASRAQSAVKASIEQSAARAGSRPAGGTLSDTVQELGLEGALKVADNLPTILKWGATIVGGGVAVFTGGPSLDDSTQNILGLDGNGNLQAGNLLRRGVSGITGKPFVPIPLYKFGLEEMKDSTALNDLISTQDGVDKLTSEFNRRTALAREKYNTMSTFNTK